MPLHKSSHHARKPFAFKPAVIQTREYESKDWNKRETKTGAGCCFCMHVLINSQTSLAILTGGQVASWLYKRSECRDQKISISWLKLVPEVYFQLSMCRLTCFRNEV